MIKAAGIQEIDFQGKFTAIKLHFGEPGNLAYIRPNYVRRVARMLQDLGAIVFLTDPILYCGRRANAVDHLETAMETVLIPWPPGVR